MRKPYKKPLCLKDMSEKKLSSEQVQEKFEAFKLLQEHIQKLAEQVEMVQQHHAELNAGKEALQALEKMKEPVEMFAPVANGIFVKATFSPQQPVLLNVGADTALERPIGEVTQLLQQQHQDLTMKLLELQAVMEEMQEQAKQIYLEIKDHEDVQQV